LFDIELPPDSVQQAEPHPPGAQEVIVCLRGSATVGPVHEGVALRVGDSAWFVADGAHRYSAGGRGARLLNLILLPMTPDTIASGGL
jgi:quercetin dioxygenase-like cupin family protein